MINEVIRFLNTRYTGEFPLLLALSGGPDSLALLHLLMEFGKKRPLKLAVAHVDHGWREESAHEAVEIANMVEQLGLPFHLQTLNPKVLKGNLEAACREERLKFFAKLCNENGYQAVLLAHHADDVAETVLKRTLEGAALSHLAGIRPETNIQGMKVWRPLLSISKADILKWLDDHQLVGINDRTNFDPKFLRSRLRMQIIPQLSDVFGKAVSAGLCQISNESEELRQYLDGQIQPYLQQVVKGQLASLLDLSVDCPANSFELKHLIRHFCKNSSMALSREVLNKAVQHVMEKQANKSFIAGVGTHAKNLYLDRGRLLIPHSQFPESWHMSIEECPEITGNEASDWKKLLQLGRGEVILPEGDYQLAEATSFLSKWWTEHKIPAFFRMQVPLLIEKGQIKHEFLTGKRLNKDKGDKWVKIMIRPHQLSEALSINGPNRPHRPN